MYSVPLATSFDEVPITAFWENVLLYHNNPHLINRRLTAALNILFLNVNFKNNLNEFLTRTSILYEVRKLPELSQQHVTVDLIKSILEPYDKNVTLQHATVDDFKQSQDDVFVSVKILLPRQRSYESCIEVTILDKRKSAATFVAVSELDRKALAPTFPYTLEWLKSGYRLCVDMENAESVMADWLVKHLFAKLQNWIGNFNGSVNATRSLSLVSIDVYTQLYQRLKEKYGKELVKAWPETTDPLKFVYEDIAIATYLIALWQKRHSDVKPTFVDLGCGNGLLVHILTSEGFSGYGIDVCKRKIWDWYPDSTTLRVQTITPSSTFLFPDVDWIIGNHSDELTPWIPVITARSSYRTNFFLLPCCCFEFSGKKYVRRNASISSYSEYLMYIRDIALQCGFGVDTDKLRIPSTKRTCLISNGRTYGHELFSEFDQRVSQLFCNNSDFEPRSGDEPVRNCTRLDRYLMNAVVQRIIIKLLDDEHNLVKTNGKSWNRGGSLRLSELAEFLKVELKEFKNQNGGLQTFLRNRRYLFEVVKGSVSLCIPSTCELTEGKYKDKPCWLNVYHYQNCFNDSDVCAYNHETSDDRKPFLVSEKQ